MRPADSMKGHEGAWARATQRRSNASSPLGKLLLGGLFAGLAGLFCWMVIEEPSTVARRVRRALSRSAVDPSSDGEEARQADRMMGRLQAAKAAGKPIGMVDGIPQALSPDQAETMARAHRIREAIRGLRSSYLSCLEQKKAGGKGIDPGMFDRELEATRLRTVAELKKCPAEEVAREIEGFRPFLGTDEGALALFEGVERAIRN